MRRRLIASLALCSSLALTACGGIANPARSTSARQALTNSPELVELEPPSVRQEMFRDLARTSLVEAQNQGPLVLFPLVQNGAVAAAPGLDARMDLLQAPDAGEPLQLSFDGAERWPEERREALQGLSEREAAELIARTLLSHWGIRPSGLVQVDRVSGTPYAAAYVDGILLVNSSFLYMAAASALSPSVEQ